MPRRSLPPTTWPVVGLCLLLAVACLFGTAAIHRLQAELGESLRADAARLRAAQQAQIHLREYRVHTIVQAAGPTDARRVQVAADRGQFLASLDALDRAAVAAVAADDRADLAELRAGWERYEAELVTDLRTQPEFRTVGDLAAWADAH